MLQVILNPVNFTQGVSVSHGLETPVVNGINLTKYATRKSNFPQLILENVHIDGDVSFKSDKIQVKKFYNL